MRKSASVDHTGPRMNINSRNNAAMLASMSEEDSAFYVPLGERIKSLRVSQGITQAELARRLNSNKTRIGHVENGYAKINLIEFCKIAAALSTTPAILLGSSEASTGSAYDPSGSKNPPENIHDTASGLLARLRTLSQDDPAILGPIVQLLENCQKK